MFVLGKGNLTLFWESKWLGDFRLKDAFSDIHTASTKKTMKVENMGWWSEDVWSWNDLGIEDQYWDGRGTNAQQQFKDILASSSPCKDGMDNIVWRLNPPIGYNVKEGYKLLLDSDDSLEPEEELIKAYSVIPSTNIPYSTRSFIWRCFLNRVPTKDQLCSHRITLNNLDYNCVLCAEVIES